MKEKKDKKYSYRPGQIDLEPLVLQDHHSAQGGSAIAISPRTIGCDNYFRQYLRSMVKVYKELAEELNLDLELIDSEMTRYAQISSRVRAYKGLDFQFIQPTDTPEIIAEKFKELLNSVDALKWYERLESSLINMDAPVEVPEKN